MTIDDRHIIKAFGKSPDNGFRLLMQKYKEPLYWHIRRLVVSHSDAQDATQEAFIRIYRSLSSLKDAKSLRGWMFRIATNEALRLIESRRQDTVSIDDDNSSANLAFADNYVDYTDLEAVRLQKAILSLPPKQQLAFNMRYYNELPFAEIASVLDSSEAAVKMNFHLAKEKIIEYMNNND